MQQTSAAYAPYADVRHTAIRVKFGLVDVAAAGDAQPSASSINATASQIGQTVNGAEGMSAKLGTLEPGQFKLDGTFALFPDDVKTEHTGWWSAAQSGEDGAFTTPPTLTFSFTEPHSSIGFTLLFDDKASQYPTDFRVQTFNAAGALVTSIDVAGNDKAECPVTLNTDAYTKVVFTFLRTSEPWRFVRVAQVLFGIIQNQDKTNTESAALLYEINPTMDSAPANEFTIKILNTDRRYNMVNPDGIYRFLQQGQALDVELAVGPREGMEFVNMGRFYYSSSKAADSGLTAEITAHSPFYAMDKTKFRKGRQGTMAVKDFVTDVFADAGFPLAVRADGAVGERQISTACDIVTHRKAVQLAVQAARCVCILTRENDVLLTEPRIGTPTDTLTLDDQTDVPVIDIKDRINTVEVHGRALAASGRTDTIHQSSVNIAGTVSRWFNYQGLAKGVSASVSGGTLVSAEYYLGAAYLTITAAGAVTVTISGTVLDSTDMVYTAQSIAAGECEQAESYDNQLVTDGQAVANWLLTLSRNTYYYNVSDRGNPARETGDTVRIYDAYGEHRAALTTRVSLKYDGTLSGTMEALGGGPGG